MRQVAILLVLLAIVSLSACTSTNYQAKGWVDGQSGIQGFAGPEGSEEPITSPYLIDGKATVVGQYPAKPHLNILLEPGANIRMQNAPYGISAPAPCPSPYGYGTAPGAPVVLDGGNTVIQRK